MATPQPIKVVKAKDVDVEADHVNNELERSLQQALSAVGQDTNLYKTMVRAIYRLNIRIANLEKELASR